MDEINLRKIILEAIEQSSLLDEEILDEERVALRDAARSVKNLEPYNSNHNFGEILGSENDSDKMYVCFSYKADFPLYVFYKGRWFENTSPFLVRNKKTGKMVPNKATERHRDMLRPGQTQGRPARFMEKLVNRFRAKHGIKELDHKDVLPGDK